jgi:hypothetical protein
MSVNRYGLDADYFREKLTIIARDADSFTPYEMYLALTRLADVVQEVSLPNEPARGETPKVNV